MSLEDLTTNELLAKAKEYERGHTLLNTLLNDPATREETLKLVKKKDPTRSIPELDAKAEMEKKLEEEREERRKLEASVRDNEIKRQIKEERERVKAMYELTDADMIEVEKLMTDKDKPIPHYDAAATVLKAQRAQAKPTTASISPPVFDMPSKDIWGKGVGNKAQLDKIALGQAYEAFNEISGGGKKAA